MTPRLTDHEMRMVETGTECFSAILRSTESFNSGESVSKEDQQELLSQFGSYSKHTGGS